MTEFDMKLALLEAGPKPGAAHVLGVKGAKEKERQDSIAKLRRLRERSYLELKWKIPELKDMIKFLHNCESLVDAPMSLGPLYGFITTHYPDKEYAYWGLVAMAIDFLEAHPLDGK